MKVKNKIKVEKKENNKAITLIALVITIIVLLILAGVSIAMLTGENGILTQAQKAKSETENAAKEEQSILDSYEDYMNGISGGQWNEEKGVNTPAIKENMELVTYNEQTGNWDTNNSTSSYDYVAGEGTEDNTESKWANAKVTIDGVESYFVWIPRYAYKITYNNPGDISAGGTIDVKFLKGTSNIAADGTVCKYADDSTLNKETDYIIHPAFTSNVDLGGWRNELTGIWVGKYETARSNATSSSSGSGTTIMVQPNVLIWANNTMENMFNYAKAYSTELKSHMLKNSEWGAVAYLTESKYGRNGTEIGMNDQNYITAMGSIIDNKDQSSTGNETGIYDLRGGASEYVPAYYNGGSSLSNGSSFADGSSDEFSTAYTEDSEETGYKPGDATYETRGWHGDRANFVNSDNPFFARGGYCSYNSSGAGIFFFDIYYGNASGGTFRMCLAVK